MRWLLFQLFHLGFQYRIKKTEKTQLSKFILLEIYPIKSHDENYECDAAYISLLKNSASRQIQ